MSTRILRRPAALLLAGICVLGAASRRASPHETIGTTIDGAEVTLTYGRPYARGRLIMGGLVPFDRVWCPGADEATTLTTTRALRVGDLVLKAGRYTLWMLPSATDWQLIVNTQTGQWHNQYDSSRDLGRVTMRKRMLAKPVEQLTFAIDSADHGGFLRMRWETTEVGVSFTVVQ